jgi:hypothetical protein
MWAIAIRRAACRSPRRLGATKRAILKVTRHPCLDISSALGSAAIPRGQEPALACHQRAGMAGAIRSMSETPRGVGAWRVASFGFVVFLSSLASTTLVDLFTLLFAANPFSAARASLRRCSSDEFEDGLAYGGQCRSRRRPVDSFFPALLF